MKPQLQQQKDDKDDEEEEEEEEEGDEKGPVPAVPGAISSTVLTILTTPRLKHSYKRSQVQQQTTPNNIFQAMHISLLQQEEAREQLQID